MNPIVIPDLVRGNAFNVLSLTASINKAPFVPGFLGGLGNRLFLSDGIITKDIAMQAVEGRISLIQTSQRGSNASQGQQPKRGLLKAVPLAHIKKERTADADQVQSALDFAAMAGQTQTQSLLGLINDQMEGPFGLRQEFNLTHEYHKLGAVQGLVLDADGTPLYDWYDYFNISRPADVAIPFQSYTTDALDFEQLCTELHREILVEMSGLPDTNMGLMALCSSTFYDRVRNNKEVVEARKNRALGKEGDLFVGGKAFKTFNYGGVDWVDYRSSDDGKVGIAAGTARLFPIDVPGMFQQLFGPPDILGMTNMKGVPIFSFLPPSRQTERTLVQEAQSNVVTVCTRPKGLRKLTIATPST